MNFLFDVFMALRKKNFTVTKEFDYFSTGKIVKEYVYNMKKYLTDEWPPKRGSGPQIKKVIRDSDGADITKEVLRFSGPMKNYINPLATYVKVRRFTFRFVRLGIQISYEETLEPYEGTVTVTNSMGKTFKV
jgi:hypothetical protein